MNTVQCLLSYVFRLSQQSVGGLGAGQQDYLYIPVLTDVDRINQFICVFYTDEIVAAPYREFVRVAIG